LKCTVWSSNRSTYRREDAKFITSTLINVGIAFYTNKEFEDKAANDPRAVKSGMM
jgi:hypothetical protein